MSIITVNQMNYGKPDIILSSVFARIFCKPLLDGRYIAPRFMYDPMSYWQTDKPKLCYGGAKIVCHMPPEYDASLLVSKSQVLSMREMAKDLTLIPLDALAQRREIFLYSWDNVVTYSNAINMQAGLSEREFEHLQEAFGPGPWERDVLIRGMAVQRDHVNDGISHYD